ISGSQGRPRRRAAASPAPRRAAARSGPVAAATGRYGRSLVVFLRPRPSRAVRPRIARIIRPRATRLVWIRLGVGAIALELGFDSGARDVARDLEAVPRIGMGAAWPPVAAATFGARRGRPGVRP